MADDVVDLADARFERDAAPGVDACLVLIQDAVLAGVTDPINAAFAIFVGTSRYLLSNGCPAELLRHHFADALALGANDAGR